MSHFMHLLRKLNCSQMIADGSEIPYRFCMLTFRDYMQINPARLHALWEYGTRVDLK